MSNVTVFTLPFPPSVNNLFVNIPGRGRVKTQRYRTWRNAAGWDIRAAKPGKFEGPVEISVVYQRPDSRRRDLDNLFKAIADALVEFEIIEDDSKIERITLEWGESRGATVTIIPRDAAETAGPLLTSGAA